MFVSPYESAIRATTKEEKDNVQRKESNPEKCRSQVQLLRDLRVWNLHLRLPEERMPLPGEQLPVRLQQACRRTLAVMASSIEMWARPIRCNRHPTR